MKTKPYFFVLLLIALTACKKDNFFENVVFAWGDSFTAGLSSKYNYPAYLRQLAQMGVVNKGVGSTTSTEIAQMMLATKSSFNSGAIIWAGRNNFRDTAQVKADIAKMVGALKTNRFLVLGIVNRNNAAERKGGVDYEMIIKLNKSLALQYGEHFIDIRQHLVDSYNPNDAADVSNHEADVTPTSLRSDALHLNELGYQVVAEKIYTKISLIAAPK